ncbi:hypothetical protein BIW11_03360 [Tropilaelaps mercedesae]|uniref:THAP-type domain-containing protein n=1 Tax=Tropilaelaps mercedesae TaxID=418985 RepID=A0A1V9XMP7_9ACAR|nr:hypothetical protein BIW11_03360 [Tropilaelaps mercedesae]
MHCTVVSSHDGRWSAAPSFWRQLRENWQNIGEEHTHEEFLHLFGGLRPEAVPTRLLDGPGDAEGDVRRCGVPRCHRTEDEVPLFKGRQAFRAVGIEAGIDLTKGWICAEHFEDSCIDDRGRLKAGSMPSRGLETPQIDQNAVKLILSEDVVEDIVDDLQDIDTRTENSSLKLKLRRAHDEIENLKKTVTLLHSDIAGKRRRIQTLEEELAQATSSWRQFEVRIVNE